MIIKILKTHSIYLSRISTDEELIDDLEDGAKNFYQNAAKKTNKQTIKNKTKKQRNGKCERKIKRQE